MESIRRYREEDLQACLAVFDSNVPRFFRPAEREEFRTYLDSGPSSYFVLEDADRDVIGCGGYSVVEEERRADLCWGMVRSDLHGRGLGRLLAEARLARAVADPSVHEIRLSTSQHTTGFYERLGFRIVSVEPSGFAKDLDRCDMSVRTNDLELVGRAGEQ